MNRITNFESARIPDAPGPVHSIALIGTYVPRQCGIGTFTSDLVGGLKALANDGRVAVVAVNDRSDGYDYPPEVEFEFNQNELREYRIAADLGRGTIAGDEAQERLERLERHEH